MHNFDRIGDMNYVSYFVILYITIWFRITTSNRSSEISGYVKLGRRYKGKISKDIIHVCTIQSFSYCQSMAISGYESVFDEWWKSSNIEIGSLSYRIYFYSTYLLGLGDCTPVVYKPFSDGIRVNNKKFYQCDTKITHDQ